MTTISPIRAEVLQGLDRGRDFDLARKRSASLVVLDGGRGIAVAAARNFRRLHALGVAVRKAVGTLIALTRCVVDRPGRWYGDRDFDPFVNPLGLCWALAEA